MAMLWSLSLRRLSNLALKFCSINATLLFLFPLISFNSPHACIPLHVWWNSVVLVGTDVKYGHNKCVKNILYIFLCQKKSIEVYGVHLFCISVSQQALATFTLRIPSCFLLQQVCGSVGDSLKMSVSLWFLFNIPMLSVVLEGPRWHLNKPLFPLPSH